MSNLLSIRCKFEPKHQGPPTISLRSSSGPCTLSKNNYSYQTKNIFLRLGLGKSRPVRGLAYVVRHGLVRVLVDF